MTTILGLLGACILAAFSVCFAVLGGMLLERELNDRYGRASQADKVYVVAACALAGAAVYVAWRVGA